MGHSTGAENQLDRLKPTTFGSAEYAREELVAELTAALTAQRYGMSKHLKDDTAAYLKAWLDSLKESPQYIKTVLLDVKKASSMLTQRIDQIALEIEEEKKAEQTENIGNEEKETENKNAGHVYYASVAYLQSSDDTAELDKLKEKGDYEGLLTLAKEYYDGNGMDEEQTYRKPCQNRGDDLLIEDKDFAVVYNGSVGGTDEVFLKHTEQEVRDHITRYGIGRATEDVKALARDMVAEEFSELAQRKMPIFQMPNGCLLNLQYDKVKDCLDVGTVTNAGLTVKHSFPFSHDHTLDANICSAYELLLDMEEYQKEEQANDVGQQEERVAKSAFHR